MRQRTPAREKMPGRGVEAGLVSKESKATGCGEVPGTEKPPVPAFLGALDDGILASDTNILIVAGLLQVFSWDKSTPLQPVWPRGRAGDCQGAALLRQPLRTQLIPSPWASGDRVSNSPGTRPSWWGATLRGRWENLRICTTGTRLSWIPGMRNKWSQESG